MTSAMSIDCNFLSFSSYCYAFVMDHLDCIDVAVGQAEADLKVIQKSVSFCEISVSIV